MNHQWFDNSRISAISDGVFAIAMTLLMLDLKLPDLDYASVAAIFLLVISLPFSAGSGLLSMRFSIFMKRRPESSRITGFS